MFLTPTQKQKNTLLCSNGFLLQILFMRLKKYVAVVVRWMVKM